MKKSWGLIPKILSGEKSIESRWYKNRIAPWDRISGGDTVYFKNAGEAISVISTVKKVLQFSPLDEKIFNTIIASYAKDICLNDNTYSNYYRSKKYCVLVFLENVRLLENPFSISKKGYGISSAWLCIDDIKKIALPQM